MADTKTSDLTAIAALAGADVLPIVDATDTTTKKASIAQLDARWSQAGVRCLRDYYGAIPASVDSEYDNTTIMQGALDDLVAQDYAVLWTPPGLWRHHGVNLDLSSDGSTKAHLLGAGRRLSKWQCLADTDTNLSLSTPSGNARDTTISDMSFTSGAYAVELSRATYNIFRNCTFEYTKQTAVRLLSASNSNIFENCWWVHNQGESLLISNGQATLVGCQIGEDSGHIQNNGLLMMNGCFAASSASKLESATGGPEGMGRCLIYNTGNGTLIVSGCNLGSNFNLVDMRYSNRVVMVGNQLSCSDTMFMMDEPNASGSSMLISGNSITVEDGGTLFSSWSGDYPVGSIFTNNMINIDQGATVTWDDALLTPSYGNLVSGNQIRTVLP